MKTRLWIAAMIYPVVNAVLFGLGMVPLLSLPALADWVSTLAPAVVAVSLVIAAPIAWLIAPRLRLRYWQNADMR